MTRLLILCGLAAVLLLFASPVAAQAIKVEKLTRLDTREREAVRQGVISMFEVPHARHTTTIGYVVSGKTASGAEYVCGFFDFIGSNGKPLGEAPFMGMFISSAAAFIRKTFVPVLNATSRNDPKVITACETVGLPMR